MRAYKTTIKLIFLGVPGAGVSPGGTPVPGTDKNYGQFPTADDE
jgi:hypothetical protein